MDYNGHMNESRYGQVFSDAGDVVMRMVGADPDYIAGGLSYFTVSNEITYLSETHLGRRDPCPHPGARSPRQEAPLYHEMIRTADDELLATCNQLLLHVSLETRRILRSGRRGPGEDHGTRRGPVETAQDPPACGTRR
jgi:carnitine 3-dehydrogenase